MKMLHAVELMRTGDPDGRGIRFSEADLQSIADSFNALGLAGRVPLKLGHNDAQPLTDGQPALGWVGRVWRDGSKLLADFTDLSDTIFNLIKRKMYKFVSVELLKDVQASTRVIPWVLDAVALLGADQPAFGTLNEIEALATKQRPALRAARRVAFKRVCFTTNEGTDMDEKEVQAMIAKATGEVTAKFTQQLADAQAKHATELAAKDEELRKERIKLHRQEIEAVFEPYIKDERIEPAVREKFVKLTGLADDARALAVKKDDAEQFAKDHAKAPKKVARTQTGSGEEDVEQGTHAEVVLARAGKLLLARGQKTNDHVAQQAAVQEVLRKHPKLARGYFDAPNEQVNEEAA